MLLLKDTTSIYCYNTYRKKGEHMISKDLQKALIEQLNKEYHSAYIYLGMSAYCSKEGFNGAANWF